MAQKPTSTDGGVGIEAYGVYLPWWRLRRDAISSTLGSGGGSGTRSVASYDEDTTSLGVEAARRVLGSEVGQLDSLVLATSRPAYLDKTNAATVHAALDLDTSVSAFDVVGSVRSGSAAVAFALDSAAAGRRTLAVCSDIRTGLPGGNDEKEGGDAAVALVFGADNVVAELVGRGSATREFLDRWRLEGEPASHVWEERFGEDIYLELGEQAVTDACKAAGINAGDVDHLVVTGVHARAMRRLAPVLGVEATAVGDDLFSVVGNTGCAHASLRLAAVLDEAAPGAVILVVTLADGADAFVYRATDALAGYRQGRESVRSLLEAPAPEVDYPRYLTWRGMLHLEPPRRPDPASPAAPPSFRSEEWKFAFTASRCTECGTRHLPPTRTCSSCRKVDAVVSERMADAAATVATFTVDRLAFTPSPPLVAATIDFDGGGRFTCELTDVAPEDVEIGTRVEMTFRRLHSSHGVHNYFWKARPERQS